MKKITFILIGLGKWIVPKLVCGYFTAERGEQHREDDREHWWRFSERAKTTTNPCDDAVAAYLRGRLNFHDSPAVKANKVLMAKAGLGDSNPPAGYVSPDFPRP